MHAVTPIQDNVLPYGIRWDVPGFFRGTSGFWELVIDLKTYRIVHFNFVAD